MMDNLTNAMIRLSEEIAALRHNRAELKSDLALGKVNLESTISGMISGFQSDRKQMGEKTRFEMRECVSSVKDAVAGLRHQVAGLRTEFASDIEGAHAAWSGSRKRAHKGGSKTKREKR